MQEGAGHAVLSAYVEIIFNNSDNRLPVRSLKSVVLLLRAREKCSHIVCSYCSAENSQVHKVPGQLTSLSCFS